MSAKLDLSKENRGERGEKERERERERIGKRREKERELILEESSTVSPAWDKEDP